MIITIEGRQGEGKTTLAHKLVNGKNFLFVEEWALNSKDWLYSLSLEKYDYLIIDSVKNIKHVKATIERLNLQVRVPYVHKTIKVELPPNVIIIKTIE